MFSIESTGTTDKKFGASHATIIFILYYLIIGGSDVFISALGFNLVSSFSEYDNDAFQIFIKLIGFLVGLSLSGLLISYFINRYFVEPWIEIAFVRTSMPWYLLAVGLGITSSLLIKTFGYSDVMEMNEKKQNPYEALTEVSLSLKIFYVCLVGFCGPFIEELVFRGALYKGFSSSWGKVVGAVIVTVMFIMIHATILQLGSWLVIGVLTFVAVLLILVREFSGSIIPPILIHQSYNLGLLFS